MSAKPRVLVVDDDQVIATTLSLILNRSGFESLHAFSGPEALTLIADSHFDILITDVMMHPMNGVELAKAFCEACPDAHVFLISGTVEAAADVLASLDCHHAFPLLKKPIYPGDLIELLRTTSAPATA